MTARKPHKAIATLGRERVVGRFITQANGVVAAMTGNPYFPSPDPPLVTITALIARLSAKQTVALTRVVGGAAERDAACLALRNGLQVLQGYVQRVADADPANAAAIVTSASMSLQKKASRDKQLFDAQCGSTSGSVLLTAMATGERASCHEWQWSLDQDTWTSLEPTLQASTSISGLIPLRTYYFCHRAITKAGRGDWSEIVALLVV